MPTTLPTHRVLKNPNLSPEGFAATVAATHDLDPMRVLAVLNGELPSKRLPATAARRVCGYLAEHRGAAAAQAALVGDSRTTVAEPVRNAARREANEAVLAAARDHVWDGGEILAQVSAAVRRHLDATASGEEERPEVRWPTGPSPTSAGASVLPPQDLRAELLVKLFDGRIETLDPNSGSFDPVAALVAVTPLARPTPTAAMVEPGGDTPVDARVGAILVAADANMAPYSVSAVAAVRDEVLAAAVQLAAAAACRYPHTGAPGIGARLSGFRFAVAAAVAVRDLGAVRDGRVAACFGADSLAEVDTDTIAPFVELLSKCDTEGRIAAAEVIDVATSGGRVARPMQMSELFDELAAKGLVVCAAITPPRDAPKSWFPAMCAVSHMWSEEQLELTAELHEGALDALCAVLRSPSQRPGEPPPRWLVHESMRRYGLAEWLRRDNESVTELLDAATELSFTGWQALWKLSESFKGTPAELVAVAEGAG